MKAWIVSPRHPIDGGSVVRFAESSGKARYAGLDALREMGEADDYTDVCARRFAEMDGREDNPPSLEELVGSHGWHTQCSGCDRVIDCDGARRLWDDEDDVPEYQSVKWFGDIAYCEGCDA